MRRWSVLVFWLVVLLSLPTRPGRAQLGAWSLQILEADERHVLLELSLHSFESEPIIHQGIQYQRLRVADWASWGQPGQPQLPMYSIPLGTPWPGDPHISIVESESETFEGYLVYPAPATELEGSQDAPQVVERFVLDADAYAAGTFQPGPLAEAAASGFLRDQPIFQLRLHPFQYHPLRRELRVYRRLKVLVVYPDQGLDTAAGSQPSLVFEGILKHTLINYDWLPRPPAPPARPSDDPLITPLDHEPHLKLYVEDSGIYRVRYQDVQAVAPDLVGGDPRRLILSNRGATVPILFDGESDGSFDPGDSFLFHGQAIHSDYTRYNIYWLKAGSGRGLRMSQRDGSPVGSTTPTSFANSHHYEKDYTYWRAVPDGEGKDHWFWNKLSTSGSTPTTKTYTFNLNHIASNGPVGELRLLLHGATYGDHLTQFYLNGSALLSPAERAWSGQVEKLFVVDVPQGLWAEGRNSLRVENIRPAGTSSSGVYVNWFEVTYQDTYVAEGNELSFSAPSAGNFTFELTGFSTDAVELLDITDPAAPVRIVNHAVETDGGGYRLRFGDRATGDQMYLAQRADQLPTPSIQLDEPSTWKSPNNGATYLIITHPSFYSAVQALAAYRGSQGESVVTVKTDDIYDEFYHGIYDPQAIRSFLKYAFRNWWPRPVYVLLLGDASEDPKNNRGSSLADLVPAYYVDTPLFGQTPNDSWYAKVRGNDDYPDIIVGRVTARSTHDVATVTDKIHMYEGSPARGDWLWRAVLVADNGHPAFTGDMDGIAGLLPTGVTPTQMYSYDPSTSVQKEINTGALLLAYSGHGNNISWGTWPGDHRIFNQIQMQGLGNGDKLPFMTVANCRNGFFNEYNRSRSMAEEFLLLNNKGGIASWAPASYGFPTANSLILEELYQALLVDDDLTLGSAATTARVRAHLRRPDLPLNLFEVFTYFGDPAVRLKIPTPQGEDAYQSYLPVILNE